MVKVLFVCMGNICRSPTAHGVFERMLEKKGLTTSVFVDSAGTGSWHAGNPPDGRAQAAAKKRGFDLSPIRARQVGEADFEAFDYILAMDQSNLADLMAQAPQHCKGKIELFLAYGKGFGVKEVPDPYFGGARGFDTVLDLVEDACTGLLEAIQRRHF